jgi:hypothetical protein
MTADVGGPCCWSAGAATGGVIGAGCVNGVAGTFARAAPMKFRQVIAGHVPPYTG